MGILVPRFQWIAEQLVEIVLLLPEQALLLSKLTLEAEAHRPHLRLTALGGSPCAHAGAELLKLYADSHSRRCSLGNGDSSTTRCGCDWVHGGRTSKQLRRIEQEACLI